MGARRKYYGIFTFGGSAGAKKSPLNLAMGSSAGAGSLAREPGTF